MQKIVVYARQASLEKRRSFNQHCEKMIRILLNLQSIEIIRIIKNVEKPTELFIYRYIYV